MSPRYDPPRAREQTHRRLLQAAFATVAATGDEDQLEADIRAARVAAEEAAEVERQRAARWRKLRRAVLVGCPGCHYCGELATTVDHLVPYSRGGEDEPENLVPACKYCNLGKLDFTVEEWRAYRIENGLPWPPEGHFAMIARITADVMRNSLSDPRPIEITPKLPG